MLGKEAPFDAIRNSVSSTHSASSQGSAFEDQDCDSSGDVFVWGEVIGGSSSNNVDKHSFICAKTDVLLPKPLVSNLLLDVHHMACGVQHAALVTKQGEIFTWGEEAGGRLGHGPGVDVMQPHLVESLAMTSFHIAACGEFHTCAITMTGELYTWGDGTHNAGLLGHGTKVSHCKPKKILGPLEGLQVVSVSCGIWHTALITSTGQLFTFGDGTFGILGHGNRDSVAYPKVVESLTGLKAVAVACGLWHTAALVEVVATKSSVNRSSRKLFTWGDGDNYRLGHGDKEPRLIPTPISSLDDYSFCKLACGHNLTVGLTTSGHVFTMGSAAHGQLGKPDYDGKLPTNVEGKLAGEFVEEVACGSYHVTVLTAKSQVYTWGKGENGRLGHGDIADRRTPTLVEALKERPVKHISCGSKFTAAICHHRWVLGTSQVHCSGCRNAFGFTRKRHHCYHCGLVFCHSCSSKKVRRAALSPNPAKPRRVCDPCYMILHGVESYSGFSGRTTLLSISGESKETCEKMDIACTRTGKSKSFDSFENLDAETAKQGKAHEVSLTGKHRVFSLSHLKDVFNERALNLHLSDLKSKHQPAPCSLINPVNSISSQEHAEPAPTDSIRSPLNDTSDDFLKQNKYLSQEVKKLSLQIENLKQYCNAQEDELQKLESKTKKAVALSTEEFTKSKVVKGMIKCLISQLKFMNEKLSTGLYAGNEARPESLSNGDESSAILQSNLSPVVECTVLRDSINNSSQGQECTYTNQVQLSTLPVKGNVVEQLYLNSKDRDLMSVAQSECALTAVYLEPGELKCFENGSRFSGHKSCGNHHVETEWVEQYEPGVYITLFSFQDGSKDLKRVRFSRRRFGEHQAASWWSENHEKVYKKYDICSSDKAFASTAGGGV